MNNHSIRKPEWLKIKIPAGKEYVQVKDIVNRHKLHTICTSGLCPNIADCWGRGTATFMILGDICTRSCKFCATKTGVPAPLDPAEPLNVAKSIKLMRLKHCVITSVDRDDLPDCGATHWAETIRQVKKLNPSTGDCLPEDCSLFRSYQAYKHDYAHKISNSCSLRFR
jgi:lipoic acid synthetase